MDQSLTYRKNYKIHSHLLSLILLFSVTSAARHRKLAGTIIADLCKASRDPPTCQSSLPHLPPDATALQGIQSALNVSSHNLQTGRAMVQKILAASAANANRTAAANNCLEVLHYADHRMNLTGKDALPRGRKKDARAWMSAAMAYQYDCWSALKYVNATPLVNETMSFFDSSVIASTSNALGMMVNYDLYGEKTGSWGPPKTERDGFWEPGSGPIRSGLGSKGGVPVGLKADVTVCKGGKCDHETVQEAVNAAPDNAGPGRRFVILIKAGVYEETVRVGLEKKNVVFFGDGMGKTVITGSKNVGQPPTSTIDSATVGVVGDGFMASNLTFQNTAGPLTYQAVAFRSDSDHSILENCEFLSNQDTLYAHTLRQFYKSCRIQGNIDFIFGNSAAFFEDCLILVAPRQQNPDKGEDNAISALGRIDPAQSIGFVIYNCVINGTDTYMTLYHKNPNGHNNYLGRPWKEFARTVIINSTLEAIITPNGWMTWIGDFALKTLYYGEFENKGPGSDTSKRVNWSNLIPPAHVYSYSVGNFIQGDEWIPKSM